MFHDSCLRTQKTMLYMFSLLSFAEIYPVIFISISYLSTMFFSFFRRVCIFVISIRLSDRLFVWINSASNGQKSVKFDFGSFMKISREILAFFLNWTKISDTTWRPKWFLLLGAKLNRNKTLSSGEMASGCHYSPGDVNNSKHFISASVLNRTFFPRAHDTGLYFWQHHV